MEEVVGTRIPGPASATEPASETVALENVFCVAVELLEQTWVLTQASYMDYNFVLKNMRRRMEGLLARRPTSLGEFRAWVLASS